MQTGIFKKYTIGLWVWGKTESEVRGCTNSQTCKIISHLVKLDNLLLQSAIAIYYLFESRKKLLQSATERIHHKMSEGVARRCILKNVSWKISEYLPENICFLQKVASKVLQSIKNVVTKHVTRSAAAQF